MDADAIDDPPRLRRTDVALYHHVLTAHSTAATTEGNWSNRPSPMVYAPMLRWGTTRLHRSLRDDGTAFEKRG
jgi:hypothetical protein